MPINEIATTFALTLNAAPTMLFRISRSWRDRAIRTEPYGMVRAEIGRVQARIASGVAESSYRCPKTNVTSGEARVSARATPVIERPPRSVARLNRESASPFDAAL